METESARVVKISMDRVESELHADRSNRIRVSSQVSGDKDNIDLNSMG
jgi:hypothetical protein